TNTAQLICTKLLAHGVHAGNDGLHGVVPGGFAPLAVITAHHGASQTIFGVQAFVGETVTVADPALVDFVVLERNNTQHLVHLGLQHQVGTHAVVRANAATTGQFPGTGIEAEGFGQQGTHGANVNHVARQFRLVCATHKGGDFSVLAAVEHTNLLNAGDFFASTHTAGAMNATLHGFGR